MTRIKRADKAQTLSTVGLFAACSKRELQTVAGLCTPLSVEEGFVLTTQGGHGQECFVIADGTATVTIGGQPVGSVGPGECVGEMSLLDGGPRTATVTAETPMNLYVLATSEFQSLLNASPAIVRKIAVSLARRLREAEAEHPH